MTAFTAKKMINEHWANVAIFSSAVILACLASLLRVYQTNPGDPVSREAKLTAILGGFLAGIFALALQIHFHGWQHPWLSVALSVPAGFGSPLVLATAVSWLNAVIKRGKGGGGGAS